MTPSERTRTILTLTRLGGFGLLGKKSAEKKKYVRNKNWGKGKKKYILTISVYDGGLHMIRSGEFRILCEGVRPNQTMRLLDRLDPISST